MPSQLDASVLATLVTPAQLVDLDGHVTVAAIRAGAPIRVADLRPPAAERDGLRQPLRQDRSGKTMKIGGHDELLATARATGGPAQVSTT